MGFWDENRWTRPYGYRPGPDEDNPYTLGFHIGQDIAGADWFGLVPALRGGTVVDSGRGALIGGYVVVQVGNVFDTYCHLNSANLPRSGTVIRAGDGIAPLARSLSPSAGTNYTGSASTGPHLHFVVSTYRDTAYNPRSGSPIDPRPIIRSIISGSAAGGGATPFPEEDDMPLSNDDLKAIFNYQVPKYDSTGKQVGTTTLAAVAGWSDANIGSLINAVIEGIFKRQTRRYGLPDGSPLNGNTTLEAYIAWSDANNLATRDAIGEAVKDALNGVQVGPGGTVDVDAVAAKVLDGMAQRLAS